MKTSKSLISLLFIFYSFNFFAQLGRVDSTFNVQDTSSFYLYFSGLPSNGNTKFHTHVYPDGSSLIAGGFTSYVDQIHNRIVKTDVNGNVDLSFNVGTGADSTITCMVVLENGKVFLAGQFSTFNGVNTNGSILLLANGAIDPLYLPSVWSSDLIMDACEQSGKLVLIGYQDASPGPSGSSFFRILQDGSIDNSFLGMEIPQGNLRHVSALPSGQLYLSGQFSQLGGIPSHGIARLLPDGELDMTFLADSASTYVSIGTEYYVTSHTLDSDGSIMVSMPGNPTRICRLFNNGDGDTSFTSPFSVGYSLYKLVALESGKYLASGSGFVVRLNHDGSIDPTFDKFNGSINSQIDVDLRPDGKMLFTNGAPFALNEDGTLFGGYNTTTGANNRINAVETLPDGKILIAGNFSSYNHQSINGIARLLPDGTLDPSFNPGKGFNYHEFTSASNSTIFDIEVQPDGKIILCGSFTQFNDQPRNRILRLHPNGELDTTFASSSIWAQSAIIEVKLQPNGQILYLAGGAMARLNDDGTDDNSFNGQVGLNQSIGEVVVLSSGKTIVGGSFNLFEGFSASNLGQLNLDGSVDNTFSTGVGFNNGVVHDIDEQTDGKLIITTTSTTYNGDTIGKLFRIFPNGDLDTTFQFEEPFPLTQCYKTLIMNSGKIITIGYNWGFPDSSYVLKINENGSIDSAFVSTPFEDYNNGQMILSADIQSNGRIILGGVFTYLNQQYTKNRLFALLGDTMSTSCQFFNGHFASIENLICGDSAGVNFVGVNGTEPYLYSWDNGAYSLDDTLFLTENGGVHQVSVIDSNGCFFSTGFLINGPTTQTEFDVTSQLVGGNFRPGFNSTVALNAYNDGCIPTSGQVTLILDTLLTFNSSTPAPDFISGDTLRWNFTDISFDSTHFTALIQLATPTSAEFGDPIHLRLKIDPLLGDADTTNNVNDYHYTVINGYDPNDKQVYPIGECIPHYIKNEQELTYTVRFQNTGNAEAINIAIVDSLSDYLDINTFRVVGTSHSMYTEVLQGNVLKFHFDQINLPDSLSDEEGSQGYVIYQISPYNSLFENTRINNKAHIYFDFNPPITTNGVFNTVSDSYVANTFDTVTLSSCDQYFWGGQNYTESGIYTQNFANNYGCDSTSTIQLEVLMSSSSELTVEAIDSFTLNNQLYTTSGQYQQILFNEVGCDSTINLNLNLNYTSTASQEKTAYNCYPNPANDYLIIEFSQKPISQQISFTTLSGQAIKLQSTFENNQIKVDLSGLPQGMYLMKIIIESEEQLIPIMKI